MRMAEEPAMQKIGAPEQRGDAETRDTAYQPCKPNESNFVAPDETAYAEWNEGKNIKPGNHMLLLRCPVSIHNLYKVKLLV